MPFTKGHPQYFFKHKEETKVKMRGQRTQYFSIVCAECTKDFSVPSHKKDRAKFCSKSCQGSFQCKKHLAGKKLSQEAKLKMSKIRLEKYQGVNHPRYIADRTKLCNQSDRRSYAYRNWKKEVYSRDNYKCRISDENCKSILEAHHILNWQDYPELRYKINNGITLCQAHHPRGRANEAKLSPYLQQLVAEIK